MGWLKIVRLILENEDIKELIKAKYKGAEIIKGLDEDLEITIKITDFQQAPQQKVEPQKVEPPIKEVRLEDGSLDASKSGLALENREHTIPGGPMGRSRGTLRTF